MEVKYKRADELDCGDVIISDGMETVIEYLEVVSGYIRINKNEVLTPPEAQIRLVCRAPSDLEIVQKALAKVEGYLECSNSYSEVRDSFGKTLFDGCHNKLLTWAKQTVGE